MRETKKKGFEFLTKPLFTKDKNQISYSVEPLRPRETQKSVDVKRFTRVANFCTQS